MDGALNSADVSPLLKFLAIYLVATAIIYQNIPSLFLIWSMCGLVAFNSSSLHLFSELTIITIFKYNYVHLCPTLRINAIS